jgi:hypothetical protein
VVAGSLLDHGEVRKLLSQLMVPKVRPWTLGSLYTS